MQAFPPQYFSKKNHPTLHVSPSSCYGSVENYWGIDCALLPNREWNQKQKPKKTASNFSKTILYGRDAILRVRIKWLIFNMVPQLWADVKYHVPTRFGFSPKASSFCPFGDGGNHMGRWGVRRNCSWLTAAQKVAMSAVSSSRRSAWAKRLRQKRCIHTQKITSGM